MLVVPARGLSCAPFAFVPLDLAMSQRVNSTALTGTSKQRFRLFCLICVVLSVSFSDDPTAETGAVREGYLGTPLIEGLSFDHVSELHR